MTDTPNIKLPMPDPVANVDDEFYRLQQALLLIDAAVSALQSAVVNKAAVNHTHTLAQVSGLETALANKMAANKTFKLTDLTDVSGSSNAATGYLLQKLASGFGFVSAAAALGNHQHVPDDVVGLGDLIQQHIAALVNSSPAALDTLSELATAIGNDPNFATTMNNALSQRVVKSGDTMTGRLKSIGFDVARAAGVERTIAFYTNTLLRWSIGAGADAESGSNAGSRLAVNRYSDTGAFLDIPFLINRNTGITEIANLAIGNKATAADIAAGTSNKFPDAAAIKAGFASVIKAFEVPDWANGGSYAVAHGLGRVPWFVTMGLRCHTAGFGYVVGEVINAFTADKSNNDGSGVIFGGYCHAGASNLNLYPGPNGIIIRNLLNGGQMAAVPANFNLVGICA